MRTIKYLIAALLFATTTHTLSLAQTSEIDHEKVREELLQFNKVHIEAYNACNVKKTAELVSDDFEFYHDKIGSVIGKEKFYKMIDDVCRRNNYDWVKSRLISELKTFQLREHGKLYGAIMTGELLFFTIDKNTGKETKESTSSFIWLMRYQDMKWTISRDMSYNHQDSTDGK
jgi:ketosteroid isomerase-like protein